MIKKFIFLTFILISPFIITAQPGCPSIDAGPNVALNCNQTSAILNATVVATGTTTTYSVIAIPYSPPYPYNTGTPILVNIDDTWSDAIPLPFNFCYYENNYSQIVPGSNGVITFDISNAGAYCPWEYTASCPSGNLPLNSIFGPYHDIDPSISGDMYSAILGTYPCRTYVVSWNQVAMYDSPCNYMLATHQIVLYESTNIIEIYIQNKPLCSAWNDGNAIVGIQNSTGTVGLTAPGRNTGQWTAQNEAWRFTPNGSPNYTITWFQGINAIGTGSSISVSPTTPAFYTAEAVYINCNGNAVTVRDSVQVTPNMNYNMSITPTNATICQGDSVVIMVSGTPATYTWTPSLGLNTTTGPNVTATPTSSTNYVVTGTNGICTGTDTVHITVNTIPIIQALGSIICFGDTATLAAISNLTGTNFIWFPGGDTLNPATVTPTTTTTYTVIGDANGCKDTTTTIVTVNPLPFITINSPSICMGSDAILTANGATTYIWNDGSSSNPYTVSPFQTTTYYVTATDANNCSDTASTLVIVNPTPTIATSGDTICSGTTATLTASGASSYVWSTGATSNLLIVTPATTTIYPVTGTNSFGCTDVDTAIAIVYPTPIIDFIANPWATEVDNPIVFTGSSNVTVNQWLWNFGDSFTDNTGANVLHTYTSDGEYVVTLTTSTDHPCVSSISHSVIIELNLQFPNVFTPNADGQNDKFEIVGLKPDKENKLLIYNRWGKKIYEKEHYENSWSGEGAADGTYFYVFTWKSYSLGREASHSGSVTILR